MGIIGALLSETDPAEIIKIIARYGPVIEALITFIETRKNDQLRAASLDDITRGFHNASQTGDTTQLMEALSRHCDASGCRTP